MILSTDTGIIQNRFGFLPALKMIREAGFDGADLTLDCLPPEKDVLALPDRERRAMADEMGRYAKELGLCFPQCHAPFDYRPGEDRGGKHYQDVVRSFEFAARIGCRQMVIHTLTLPESVPTEERDRIDREYLRSFLPYAREFGVSIGVENLFWRDQKRDCMCPRHGDPRHMNAFIDSLNDPLFLCCCDVGHSALGGCEPEDFIAGIRPERMTMLHIHDVDYRNDLHTLPFLSKLNWRNITDALARIGYRGAMNLEVLFFYEKFPDALIPDALRIAARTAKELASMVENAQ